MSSEQVSHWSWFYWNRGDFLHRVDLPGHDLVTPDTPSIPRYAGRPEVAHQILYGQPGKAGCVLVLAPSEPGGFSGDFNELLVPLHSHPTDHIALVVRGSGTFLVRRQVDGEDVMLMAKSGPGTLLFYPAGIPHTFICGKDGIDVASVQAEYETPSSVRFSDLAPAYLNTLPRMEYEHYLAQSDL